MVSRIQATFDGRVFRPHETVVLPPNTSVHLTVEPVESAPPVPPKQVSFLETAAGLNLEGPEDWSSNLHSHYPGGSQ